MSGNPESTRGYCPRGVHGYANSWIRFEETFRVHLWVIWRKLYPCSCQALSIIILCTWLQTIIQSRSRDVGQFDIFSWWRSQVDSTSYTKLYTRYRCCIGSIVDVGAASWVYKFRHCWSTSWKCSRWFRFGGLAGNAYNQSCPFLLSHAEIPRGVAMLPNPSSNTTANTPSD